MNSRLIDTALATLIVAFGGVAIRRSLPTESAIAAVPVPPVVAPRVSALDPDTLASAARRVVEANPFRVNRVPALIRIGRPIDLTAQPRTAPAPARVRPPLGVKAIVGGPPWTALLEGVPGATGATVVREGAKHGELTVLAISRDTVTVSAPDTVWKLTIKRSAQ